MLNTLRIAMGFTCTIGLVLSSLPTCIAQQSSSIRNVVLITLDGLRSEEVFTGADQRLMVTDNGVEDPVKLKRKYWKESTTERREILLPFIWEKCKSDHGWIAGDLQQDSMVSVTNGMYFSYPGYNELLTGAADPKVDSNDKKYNNNVTVLEWLNQQSGFEKKVAAYGSWDVFPYIINDQRSGIAVNAGWMPLTVGDPVRLAAFNFAADNMFHEWEGVRYDVFTAAGAIEELRANHPRVLYLSLGETDDWAHRGRYDRYLQAAQQNDRFIQQMWEATQSMPQYRDQTLFLITTDHGRGDGRDGWKNHGKDLPGSEYIWIAAIGPGLTHSGIDHGGHFQQAQIAATVAASLGLDFASTDSRIAKPLPVLKSHTPQ